MTSENTVELAIPATALARSIAPHGVLMTEAEEADQIRYVAAPVVAAELRRIADELHVSDDRARTELVGAKQAGQLRDSDMWFGRSVALEATVDMLRARADELDPGSPAAPAEKD